MMQASDPKQSWRMTIMKARETLLLQKRTKPRSPKDKLKAKGNDKRPRVTTGDHVRPRETTGDHGRQQEATRREATGGNVRQRDATRGSGRQREAAGGSRGQLPCTDFGRRS